MRPHAIVATVIVLTACAPKPQGERTDSSRSVGSVIVPLPTMPAPPATVQDTNVAEQPPAVQSVPSIHLRSVCAIKLLLH